MNKMNKMNISLRKCLLGSGSEIPDDCGNLCLAKFDAIKTNMLQVNVLHITTQHFKVKTDHWGIIPSLLLKIISRFSANRWPKLILCV